MASISRESNGRRTVQFVGADGKRRSIRLGKAAQRSAEAVKVRVEALVTAQITGGSVDDDTARWLAGLDTVLSDKLAAVGLVARRESATLASFIDSYVACRVDVKPRTKMKYHAVRDSLVGYFGAARTLRSINAGEADEWRLRRLADGLAENTVRRQVAVAKLFFGAAKRKRLVAENVFSGLKAAIRSNPARFHFITLDDAARVIDACPDAQWRLLFALARFGGLRVPSEPLALRWADVDWQRGRILVHSCKTEHHPGGESRVIPMFPELRRYLEDAWELAERGAEYVITRYRDSNANLRTQLNRIIAKAGLAVWPKIFQNLRSTRETELAQKYPLHVVCKWLGNSQPVAARHYLQLTDAHFDQAAREETDPVQNPVQQPSESICEALKAHREKPGIAGVCDGLLGTTPPKVAAVGVEPTTRGL